MATAVIPVERFRSSSLPAICAITGLPAAQLFAFRLGGVGGGLPLHGSAVRAIAHKQLAVKALFALTLGLFLVAVAVRSPFVGAITACSLVGSITAAMTFRFQLPRASLQDKQLNVRGVHAAFVIALTKPAGASDGCAGCPTSESCSSDEKEVCDGHSDRLASV